MKTHVSEIPCKTHDYWGFFLQVMGLEKSLCLTQPQSPVLTSPFFLKRPQMQVLEVEKQK